MTRIILVRHGETTWNVEGRYQGQEDTPLSERGLEQGRLLAKGSKIFLSTAPSPARSSAPSKPASFVPISTISASAPTSVSLRSTTASWEGRLASEIAEAYPEDFCPLAQPAASRADARRR